MAPSNVCEIKTSWRQIIFPIASIDRRKRTMHFPRTAPRNYERRGDVDRNMAVREVAPEQNGDVRKARKQKYETKFESLTLKFPAKASSGQEHENRKHLLHREISLWRWYSKDDVLVKIHRGSARAMSPHLKIFRNFLASFDKIRNFSNNRLHVVTLT